MAIGISDAGYYLSRLDLTESTKNISSLVYLQGWEIITNTFASGHYAGAGFMQLGIIDQDLETSSTISLLTGEDLNVRDGGFAMAKLIGEFGVFALIPLVFLGYRMLSAIRALRRISVAKTSASYVQILAASSVAGYAGELLVRGSGYFTGTTALLFAALIMQRLAPIRDHNIATISYVVESDDSNS
jgi:hypothetical protein